MLRNRKRWLLSIALLAIGSVPSYAAQVRSQSVTNFRNICMLHDTEWEPFLFPRPPILESPELASQGFESANDAPITNSSDIKEFTYTELPSEACMPTTVDEGSPLDTFADSNPYNNLSQAFIPFATTVAPCEEGIPPAPSAVSAAESIGAFGEASNGYSICTPVYSKASSVAHEEYMPYDMQPSLDHWMGAEQELQSNAGINEAGIAETGMDCLLNSQPTMAVADATVAETSVNSSIMNESAMIDSSSIEAQIESAKNFGMDEGCFATNQSGCPYEANIAPITTQPVSAPITENSYQTIYDASNDMNQCPYMPMERFNDLFSQSRIYQAQTAFSSAIMGWNQGIQTITENIVNTTNSYDFAEPQELCDPHANFDGNMEETAESTPVIVNVESTSTDLEMRLVSTNKTPSLFSMTRKQVYQKVSTIFGSIGRLMMDISDAFADESIVR